MTIQKRAAMSDLPLDETALQAAHKTFRAVLAAGRGDSWDYLVDAAISTYLREAGFEIQKEYHPTPTRRPTGMQRQIGPWEKSPVVQAESEEE